MIDINQYLTGASPYNNAYALNYGDGDYSLETPVVSVPSSSNDIQHTIKDGETLQNIAYKYYGDFINSDSLKKTGGIKYD